jgi:hypothetical protein
MRAMLIAAAALLAACSSNSPPPANTAEAQFVANTNTIQVKVSDTEAASSALLVGPGGSTYPASGINVSQTPHTAYNPAPTIGFGIGGFGGNVGSGMGIGMPLGGPTPAYTSDQYVSTVTFAAPPDYAANWQSYRVQVQVGNRSVSMSAPKPG